MALKHWDRERGFVKPVSEFPLADLYVCWDKKAIYLGLYAQDVVEDTFYKDKTVRAGDRAEWIVSISGSTRPIQGRIGAGLEPIVNEPAVRVVNISGVNGNLRNIACLEMDGRVLVIDCGLSFPHEGMPGIENASVIGLDIVAATVPTASMATSQPARKKGHRR